MWGLLILISLLLLGQNCGQIHVAKVQQSSSLCLEPESYQISVAQEPGSSQIEATMTQTVGGEVSLLQNKNINWTILNQTTQAELVRHSFSTPPQCGQSLEIAAQFESSCGAPVQTSTQYIDSRCETPPPEPQECPAPAAGIAVQNGTTVYPNNVSVEWGVPTVNFTDIFGISMVGPLSQTPNYISPNVFPGYGGGRVFLIQKNKYLSLKFTVPTDTEFTSGYWRTDGPASITGVPRAKVSMIISKCPGVFDPTKVPAGCAKDSIPTLEGTLVYWSTSTINGLCRLEKGQTYYMSILNAPLTNPTQSFCTNSVCLNQFSTLNVR